MPRIPSADFASTRRCCGLFLKLHHPQAAHPRPASAGSALHRASCESPAPPRPPRPELPPGPPASLVAGVVISRVAHPARYAVHFTPLGRASRSSSSARTACAMRHGHYQVIMRSRRRGAASALIRDKRPALGQQPPAHESLRRLAQQHSQPRNHLRLRRRRRQPARLTMLAIHPPIALARARCTPAPQRRDCCARLQSTLRRTPLPALRSTRARSSGRSRSRSSAHCSPVAISTTCTAAKSPSSPPPAESTATTYSRPTIGFSHTCNAPLRLRSTGSGASRVRWSNVSISKQHAPLVRKQVSGSSANSCTRSKP